VRHGKLPSVRWERKVVCATALAFKTDRTGVGGQGKWEAKWASVGE
jgi:hypothetical protein